MRCSVFTFVQYIYIIYEKAERYLGYYVKYILFNSKGSKSKVTKYGILAQVCVSVRLL